MIEDCNRKAHKVQNVKWWWGRGGDGRIERNPQRPDASLQTLFHFFNLVAELCCFHLISSLLFGPQPMSLMSLMSTWRLQRDMCSTTPWAVVHLYNTTHPKSNQRLTSCRATLIVQFFCVETTTKKWRILIACILWLFKCPCCELRSNFKCACAPINPKGTLMQWQVHVPSPAFHQQDHTVVRVLTKLSSTTCGSLFKVINPLSGNQAPLCSNSQTLDSRRPTFFLQKKVV